MLGTQVLLDAAKQIGVTKFDHVSTDEVYGELDFDPTTFFTEETPLQPNSPYSASKASSDLLVRVYHETHMDYRLILLVALITTVPFIF